MSKISELSDGGSLQSTDYLIAVRSGGNVKVQADGNLSLGALTLTGLTVDTNTLHVDATNNRVGIGTTSPSSQLEVSGSAGPLVKVTSTATGTPTAFVYSSTNGADFGSLTNHPTRFYVNNSERARLDASGNLLVGKTAVDNSVVGVTASGGQLSAVCQDAAPLFGNRTNSDGDIAVFRKDNSTVGSIGAYSGGLYIGSPAGTDAFIGFTNSIVYPSTSAGVGRDAAIDLGSSGSRFKDLYLSGLANVGGVYNAGIYNQTSGDIQFWVPNVGEAVRIQANTGNVGIGTSSPGAKLNAVVAYSAGTIVPSLKLATVGGYNSGSGTAIDFGQDQGTYSTWVTGRVASPRTGSNWGGSLTFSTNDDSSATALVERMRIDSSGNVTIGSTDAGNAGTLNLSVGLAGTTTGGVQLWSTTTGTHYVQFGDGTTGGDPYRGAVGYNHTADALLMLTAGSERARIDSSGNLLVGTTASGFNGQGLPLVVGSGSGNTGMTIYSGAAGYGTIQFADTVTTGAGSYAGVVSYNHTSDFMYFSTAASERMRIDSSGRLLLNETASRGTNLVGQMQTQGQHAFTTINGEVAGFVGLNSNGDNSLAIGADPDNLRAGSHIIFYMDGLNEKMRLDASGNLLVGTTTNYRTAKLVVGGSIGGGTGVEFDNADSTSWIPLAFHTGAGTLVGYISSTTTTTAYNTSSDARLKENIADAESASELIDAIQVRSFDWKTDGSHQRYGMVAQELLEVAPEAVSQPEDPDDMMGVDYSKLVPMLVKEIQSLRARVAQLEGV